MRWRRASLGVFIGAFLLVATASYYVRVRYSGRIYSPSRVPSAPVALVFGAGLGNRGRPSPLLAERLDTAVELYRAGKVQKVLLSGDNSVRWHDETQAMRRYTMDRGVPSEAVLKDFAGFSTYDSCFRAKAVFGVNRAILVTQSTLR